MPPGRPSGTLFAAQSLLWVSLPPSFALPGRVEAENWSPRGPKGVSGGPRKSPKIDSKSLSVSIGGLRRVGGYPPGACGTPKVHIYAYLCMYFCVFIIFIHIYACLCLYSCVFMHIYAYFMHMYAYSCMFMHIYVYLCISSIQGKYILYSKYKVMHHWTQFELFINHYRNNQHIFRCCTRTPPCAPLYPPPCLSARSWRVVALLPCNPTGYTPQESIEKWQSHCSE